MRRESSSSVKVFYPRFDRQHLLQRLNRGISALKEALPLKWAILFGSYARGSHTVASDIDLLVIYNGEAREDAFALVKKTLCIPGLEPHVYSESQYEAMRETLHRMVQDGVVIYGDQPY
ncbi:MAG: nucleotidyltransferase domain-containing protein [bacterium]